MTPLDLPPEQNALLAAIVAGEGEYKLRHELESAGHDAATLEALVESGWVEVLEAIHGLPLGPDAWVTFTVRGAKAFGVRLIEFEDGKPVWASASMPEPETVVCPPEPGAKRLGEGWEDWLSELVDKRRRQREEAEAIARGQARRAAESGWLVDPRTGEPLVLWGARIGRRTQRVGATKGGVE